jgi:hypothetical protein
MRTSRTVALQGSFPAAGPTGDPVNLGRLLSVVGPDTLRVVCAPDHLDAVVLRIRLWDLSRSSGAAFDPGDLILLTVPPGPDVAHRLSGFARRVAELGVVALVVGADQLNSDWLAPAARAGLAVLVADGPPTKLREELLAALELGPRGEAPADLRSLIDAVAADLDATVILTDDELRPLAHRVVGAIDPDVQAWIVQGTPTGALRDRLPVRGRLLGLGWGVDLLAANDWTLTAVRVGNDVLGGLWIRGVRPQAAPLLRTAARRAAWLLARRGAPADPEHRLRGDLLHSALTGAVPVGDVGLAGELRLIGLEAPKDIVELRVGSLTSQAAVAQLADRVYALVPAELDATRVSGGGRCAVSGTVEDLVDARADVDRLLGLIDDEAVLCVAEHRSALVLAELIELGGGHARLRRGAVAQLAATDDEDGTDYLRTLRAYFATGQDVQRAANELYVHRNTLRYRLDRIKALTGLDLDDPVMQLVAALQLRMHDAIARVSQ